MTWAVASGCTLSKPLVGAVVAPIQLLAESSGGCGCSSGEEVCAVLLIGSAIGAGAGLVTGVISDINWLTDRVDDPTVNWYDPFATNGR